MTEAQAMQFLAELEANLTTAPKATETRHLTTQQRDMLGEIFSKCETKEFLLCVARLVAYSVPNYKRALAAGDLIRKAARTVGRE